MTVKEKYEDYCRRGLIRPTYDVVYDEDKGFYCDYYYPKNLSERQMEREIEKAEFWEKAIAGGEKFENSGLEF